MIRKKMVSAVLEQSDSSNATPDVAWRGFQASRVRSTLRRLPTEGATACSIVVGPGSSVLAVFYVPYGKSVPHTFSPPRLSSADGNGPFL